MACRLARWIPEACGIGMIDGTVGRRPCSLVVKRLNRRRAMIWIRA
jgi:hypothetical protein